MHFSFLNKFSKKNKNGNKMTSSSILPNHVTQEMVNTIKFIDNISKIAISESDKTILHSVHEILLSSALQTTENEYYRYTQGNHLFSIPLMESTNNEFEYSIYIDVESIVKNLIVKNLLTLSYIAKHNFSY